MDDKQLTELVEWAEKPTWSDRKVIRQRLALDALVRRTTTLRFGVKVMEQILGRPVTREEWVAARALVADEQHRDRIDAEPVSA